MKLNKRKVSQVPMETYMIPKFFRTVARDAFELPHGEKEIPVIIDLTKETISKLSFPVSKRKQIFGFITAQEKLLQRFHEVKRIQIEPTEEDYFLILVIEKRKDEYYLVTEKEVIMLLEGALRIPEQR